MRSGKYNTGWETDFYKEKHEYLRLLESALQIKQETDVSFLEDSLCDLTGRRYAVACASGTDAIHASLVAAGIGPGDVVLVTPFSWMSSVTPVLMVGAIPVFCDIDPQSYHIDIEKMMISYIHDLPNVCAIIFPQLFGFMTDLTEMTEFLNKKNIVVIEDACQAIGASVKGIPAGSQGNISTFSFNANKNIAGFNGGGAILTDDRIFADACRTWRQHGNGVILGRNSKMLYANATIIDYRLTKIWEYQLRRQTMADVYNEKLKDYPVELQNHAPNVDHSYHKFVIKFESQAARDAVKDKVGGVVHYPEPLNKMPLLARYSTGRMPIAESVCNRILSIPFHHWFDPEDVATQANQICEVLDGTIS